MTMNGDAPDSAPEAAPTIEELIRTTLEEVREVRAIETRHAVDIAGMRGDLARHMDRLEGKIDAAISDSRQTRAELKAHGRLLTHMFESLGALVTHADRDREEILQIKGGLAIVRDHTAAQWAVADQHRKAMRRSDPGALRPLDEDTKIRNLPSLSEIDLSIERKIDQRELDKHRKRWEKLLGALIAIFVAAASAVLTYLLRR